MFSALKKRKNKQFSKNFKLSIDRSDILCYTKHIVARALRIEKIRGAFLHSEAFRFRPEKVAPFLKTV